jgi:predicted metal-dependent phosphoesterase TrpH
MKLDAHVHTVYSGASSIRPLRRFMAESYNTPEDVYRRAKARGMDLVAITDHDAIDGALTIADRPDVIVGSEVTGVFAADGVRVHLGVLGVTESQHREIQRLRRNIVELMPYLKQEGIFVSLNHVASRVNGRITPAHIAALLPWIDGLEIRNGSRLCLQNRTASALASTHRKVGVAGSDSHTRRGIGRTWIEAPHATTREAFLRELHAGRVRAGGRHGSVFTMTSDVLRVTSAVYRAYGRDVLDRPWSWRPHVALASLAAAAPLVIVPVVLAALHFVLEARFNRGLIEAMGREPRLAAPEWA